MADLFGRVAKLVASNDSGGGLDLSQMHFKFDIERGDIETPNTAIIRVYNLSEETKQKINKEYTRVTLEAGYADNIGIVFDGEIKYRYAGKESAIDSYIDIVASDGDSAYNFAVISTTVAAGSTAGERIGILARQMEPFDVKRGYIPNDDGDRLPRAKVMFGMVRDYMRDTTKTLNSTWSIQDGRINVISKTDYIPGNIIEMNAATGMVGFPEQTPGGIIVTTLLNPLVKIGSVIKINNASIQLFRFSTGISGPLQQAMTPSVQNDGLYKVLWVEHSGDTRGNKWYSKITCIGIDDTVKSQAIIKKLQVNDMKTPVDPWGAK